MAHLRPLYAALSASTESADVGGSRRAQTPTHPSFISDRPRSPQRKNWKAVPSRYRTSPRSAAAPHPEGEQRKNVRELRHAKRTEPVDRFNTPQSVHPDHETGMYNPPVAYAAFSAPRRFPTPDLGPPEKPETASRPRSPKPVGSRPSSAQSGSVLKNKFRVNPNPMILTTWEDIASQYNVTGVFGNNASGNNLLSRPRSAMSRGSRPTSAGVRSTTTCASDFAGASQASVCLVEEAKRRKTNRWFHVNRPASAVSTRVGQPLWKDMDLGTSNKRMVSVWDIALSPQEQEKADVRQLDRWNAKSTEVEAMAKRVVGKYRTSKHTGDGNITVWDYKWEGALVRDDKVHRELKRLEDESLETKVMIRKARKQKA